MSFHTYRVPVLRSIPERLLEAILRPYLCRYLASLRYIMQSLINAIFSDTGRLYRASPNVMWCACKYGCSLKQSFSLFSHFWPWPCN